MIAFIEVHEIFNDVPTYILVDKICAVSKTTMFDEEICVILAHCGNDKLRIKVSESYETVKKMIDKEINKVIFEKNNN